MRCPTSHTCLPGWPEQSNPPLPPTPGSTHTEGNGEGRACWLCHLGPPSWEGQVMSALLPTPSINGDKTPGGGEGERLGLPQWGLGPGPSSLPNPSRFSGLPNSWKAWCKGYSGCKFLPPPQWKCGSSASSTNSPCTTHFPSKARASRAPLRRRVKSRPSSPTGQALLACSQDTMCEALSKEGWAPHSYSGPLRCPLNSALGSSS